MVEITCARCRVLFVWQADHWECPVCGCQILAVYWPGLLSDRDVALLKSLRIAAD